MDRNLEFFPLLNELLFKQKSEVPKHIITKSDMFMFIRYASFYSPGLINVINEMNKLNLKINNDDGQYFYEVMESIIPKLKKTYINYMSKKTSEKMKKANKFVQEYSRKHNISEQKVWQMLYQIEQIEK